MNKVSFQASINATRDALDVLVVVFYARFNNAFALVIPRSR